MANQTERMNVPDALHPLTVGLQQPESADMPPVAGWVPWSSKHELPEWLEKDRYRYAFESAGLIVSDEQIDAFIEGLKSHEWVYNTDYPGY